MRHFPFVAWLVDRVPMYAMDSRTSRTGLIVNRSVINAVSENARALVYHSKVRHTRGRLDLADAGGR